MISKIRDSFSINCDSTGIAESLYDTAKDDLFEFLKIKHATHYQRLTNFGLEKDLRYCLTRDVANVLPFYENERLVLLK